MRFSWRAPRQNGIAGSWSPRNHKSPMLNPESARAPSTCRAVAQQRAPADGPASRGFPRALRALGAAERGRCAPVKRRNEESLFKAQAVTAGAIIKRQARLGVRTVGSSHGTRPVVTESLGRGGPRSHELPMQNPESARAPCTRRAVAQQRAPADGLASRGFPRSLRSLGAAERGRWAS